MQTSTDVVSVQADIIKEDNTEINDTEIKVTFKLAAQKYYLANGNLGSVSSADFVVKITGLKPPQSTNL